MPSNNKENNTPPKKLASPPRLSSPARQVQQQNNTVRSILAATMQDLETAKNSEAFVVPLASLQPNPNQPRQTYNPQEEEELADSILKHGILQPLVVRKISATGYEIIAGERRFRAAKQVDLKEVPVIVKNLDDTAARTVTLIENLQRANLDELDEARHYQWLMDTFNLSQTEIAGFVHKSRYYVQTRLNKLTEAKNNVSQETASNPSPVISEKNNKVLEKSKSLEKSQLAVSYTTRKTLQKPLTRFTVFLNDTLQNIEEVEEDGKQFLKEQIKELQAKLKEIEKQL